jgi:hypothetical protein
MGIEGQEKQTGGGHCCCRSAFTGAARVILAVQEGNGNKAAVVIFVSVAVVSLGSSEVLVAAGTGAASSI